MPSPTVRFPDPPRPSPTHRRLVLTAIVIGTAVIAVALQEPSLRPGLDGWIAAHPRAVEARIARGMYFVNLAGARRGGGYAVNTNRGQFSALDATLDSSFADIRVALRHDPSNLAAYW